MKLTIGSKHCVTNVAPYNLYTGHNKDKIPTFIEVEILEEKESKGEFTDKPNIGYLCKGSDGYTYGFNYPRYNEGYGNTCFHRYLPDGEFKALSSKEANELIKDYLWVDVTHYQCPAEPTFLKDYPYLGYCELHQHIFRNDDGCWRCEHDIQLEGPEVKMNMEEHRWVGWYPKPMRDLYELIDRMIKLIPKCESSFINSLNSVKTSIPYTAPEAMSNNFHKVNSIINFEIEQLDKDWKKHVVYIWTDGAHGTDGETPIEDDMESDYHKQAHIEDEKEKS